MGIGFLSYPPPPLAWEKFPNNLLGVFPKTQINYYCNCLLELSLAIIEVGQFQPEFWIPDISGLLGTLISSHSNLIPKCSNFATSQLYSFTCSGNWSYNFKTSSSISQSTGCFIVKNYLLLTDIVPHRAVIAGKKNLIITRR